MATRKELRKGPPRPEKPRQVHAFELWYSLGKDFTKTLETLRLNTPPIVISNDTLYRWAKDYNWQIRARERDDAILKRRTEDSIREQIEFMKRKGNYGKLLQRRALEFLNRTQQVNGQQVPIEHVTNAATAAQLLQLGVQLEGQALGMPEWIAEVLTADDETLRRVYETALAEFAASARLDDNEGDEEATFPATVIGSVPEDTPS